MIEFLVDPNPVTGAAILPSFTPSSHASITPSAPVEIRNSTTRESHFLVTTGPDQRTFPP